MAKISQLKRADVEATTEGLKIFFQNSKWIGSSNRYSKDVVAKLSGAEPKNSVEERNLAQYIASSASLHVNDGWSYLGRAIACLLTGDAHRAIHLAYYAELRAAMSLLASSGIGVFKNKHYIVSGKNCISKLINRSGTHILTWLALNHWSTLSDSGALFSKLVKPEGKTLDDWFSPLGGSALLTAQAQSWFLNWGMDLKLATEDREARNSSSYRPDSIPDFWTIDAKDSIEYVRDMWQSLEPSSSSGFEQLDRHILRISLEKHFFARTGKNEAGNDPAFVRMVDSMVTSQALTNSTTERLKKFLLRKTQSKDPLIFSYSSEPIRNSGVDVFAVLSRAILLLRVATGSTENTLRTAGIDANALSFWSEKIGVRRGLWPGGSRPDNLSDLWVDIKESLSRLDTLENDEPASLESIYSFNNRANGLLDILSSHERVSLWGLLPA